MIISPITVVAHLKQAPHGLLDSDGQRAFSRNTDHSSRTVCVHLAPAPFKVYLDTALYNWSQGEGEDMLDRIRHL